MSPRNARSTDRDRRGPSPPPPPLVLAAERHGRRASQSENAAWPLHLEPGTAKRLLSLLADEGGARRRTRAGSRRRARPIPRGGPPRPARRPRPRPTSAGTLFSQSGRPAAVRRLPVAARRTTVVDKVAARCALFLLRRRTRARSSAPRAPSCPVLRSIMAATIARDHLLGVVSSDEPRGQTFYLGKWPQSATPSGTTDAEQRTVRCAELQGLPRRRSSSADVS